MKTRILILLMTLILSGGISQAESAYSKLVEPGRTWWYRSHIAYNKGNDTVILGLTLTDPVDGWTPCYALDSLQRPVLDVPLCHLKEEESRVYIRPNLELSETIGDKPTNEQYILSYFLGYWYGDVLWTRDWWDVDPTWNPEHQTEFLLYDFNYSEDDSYEWPWTGMNIDFEKDPVYDIFTPAGPLWVSWKNKLNLPTGIETENEVEVYELKQIRRDGVKWCWGEMRIAEGIGSYSGEPESYVPAMRAWYGFFICPAALSIPDISSMFDLPGVPVLYKVVDKDGENLYLDPKYIKDAGIENGIVSKLPSDTNLPLYDLHGRRVSNPTPGSVYIRGGKKYIWK
ncbi:MAG: hypothetical protein K2J70_05405 [Muribaculaceae bacterium]|nr:hypothetical protein [Muribaculaceae bacterium]